MTHPGEINLPGEGEIVLESVMVNLARLHSLVI